MPYCFSVFRVLFSSVGLKQVYSRPHPPAFSPHGTRQSFLSDFLKEFTSTPKAFALLYRSRVLNITPEVMSKPPKAGCGRTSPGTSNLWQNRVRLCPCTGLPGFRVTLGPVQVLRRAVTVGYAALSALEARVVNTRAPICENKRPG